ncbi:MAG TPA: hypothetical protein PLK28_16350 [Candidatus Rifleibacterium sp.]|jgi:hypothetical protein|nr:hypothetical protein [Candidatus Rifleibacterium sp.]
MGEIQLGIPLETALFLSQKLSLKTFVEGGTFEGATAITAAPHFKKVFTIEKSEAMHATAVRNLNGKKTITLLKGDTREHLPALLKEHNDFLFWLDAHWSGNLTYGEGDECPLIEELKMIFASKRNFAIMIDDARMFLAPPPLPHVATSWPNVKKIVSVMPDNYDLYVFQDVIYVFPVEAGDAFRDFLQKMVTDDFNKKNVPPGLATKIKGKMRSLLKG